MFLCSLQRHRSEEQWCLLGTRESARVSVVSRPHCFMGHTLMVLHSQQQTTCRVSKY